MSEEPSKTPYSGDPYPSPRSPKKQPSSSTGATDYADANTIGGVGFLISSGGLFGFASLLIEGGVWPLIVMWLLPLGMIVSVIGLWKKPRGLAILGTIIGLWIIPALVITFPAEFTIFIIILDDLLK